MSMSAIASRYASALFQLAKEQKLLEQLEDELRVVRKVVKESQELNTILKSPRISKSEKEKVINRAFSALNPYIVNTIKVLVDRHRTNEIPQVAEGFIELANAERGIAVAEVTSIRRLTEEESQALSAAFAARSGKKSLRIENKVDSNLLGGVKVRIGNRIFDGSLKGKLERLERQLLH